MVLVVLVVGEETVALVATATSQRSSFPATAKFKFNYELGGSVDDLSRASSIVVTSTQCLRSDGFF